MSKHASLCVLAYKRPDLLKRCIESIIRTADFPYTLIVNLDGDDSGNAEYLFDLYKQKRLSSLIMNAGNNRGVGRSLQNCLGLTEGHYIFKIDTDLIFKEGWLKSSVNLLNFNQDIGVVSLFNYNHYDTLDTRFCVEEEYPDCFIVNDFVSSIWGARRDVVERIGFPIEDDGYQQKVTNLGYKMAITKEDYVENRGFGVGKSVYISGTEDAPFKTPTHQEPLIFHKTAF